MQLKITVEVLANETGSPIAQGEITGDLDLKRGNPEGQPVLSIRMRNILANVSETIYNDSQPETTTKS